MRWRWRWDVEGEAARLAHHEGRSSDALENIREAIALLKATDDEVTLARAYLLSAGIETNDGDAAAARRHLEKAKILLAASATPEDRGMILIGDSRIACLEGDSERAIDEARKAMDILGEFHAGEQGEAVWALARGLAATRTAIERLNAEPDVVFILKIKEQQFQDAINTALGVDFQALVGQIRCRNRHGGCHAGVVHA